MDSDHYDLSAYPLFRSVLGGKPQTAKPKRCLVIDPSDDASDEARTHADTLWKYVIQPAILDTDYEAHRAASTAPAIDQRVINAVLDEHLVIAVLTFENPRVFYGTALAQAAARPLILMIEEGRELAFDPRNAKVVTYRLDTESVVSALNVSRLQAAVREIADTGRVACHGFRPGTAALGGPCENSVTVYERSPQFSYDRRLGMMREAETRIDVMGIANLTLATHPDTVEVVRARSGGRLEIRILQCAPSNAGLAAMLGPRKTDALGEIQAGIDLARDAWRRIADAPGLDLQMTIRRAQGSLPMANALITDRAVVATPYLRSRRTAESPTLHARAGDAYHAAMSEEFNLLWGEATTVFRADRAMLNGHGRHADANRDAASYWAPPAASAATAPLTASAGEPAPANGPPANDDADQGDAAPAHASNGNDLHGSVHNRLFGSPDGNSGPAGEAPSNRIALKPPPLTINRRGHAIIRPVG